MLYWRAPNTEADGKSDFNNVRVGGPPTQKLTESQISIMCELAGPNTENFLKNFNRQWKLGTGPNIKADGKSDFNNVEVGGTSTQRIS
ncbi:hypothetical protein M398_00920 [Staphylococcus aureus S130]|nr:hypothetical protein M398_00920 [Staphylococcus aureus S130]